MVYNGETSVTPQSALNKLQTNSNLNRSSVMAESLSGYSGIVKERVLEIKKSIQNLQKERLPHGLNLHLIKKSFQQVYLFLQLYLL